MRAHCIQHVPFETPGCIEPWLRKAGFDITSTRLFETTRFADPDDLDILIVMGGPMSVNDGSTVPWLADEKQFIRKLISKGVSVLGVCLGAQLIASAMGARVYRNLQKEIGWFPVKGIAPANPSAFRFPPSALVFHWHGETFDLPPGGALLAKSDACENQAFQIGPNVLGLQFHLEMTPDGARALVDNCRGELVPEAYVQTEEELLAAPALRYETINGLMHGVLTYLVNSRMHLSCGQRTGAKH